MLLHLFIAALWSPEGKGPTSWLLFVMFIVSLLLSHLVSWYLCGTWLYGFLILAVFFTFIAVNAKGFTYFGVILEEIALIVEIIRCFTISNIYNYNGRFHKEDVRLNDKHHRRNKSRNRIPQVPNTHYEWNDESESEPWIPTAKCTDKCDLTEWRCRQDLASSLKK